MESQESSTHLLQEHSSLGDGGIKPISADAFADAFTAPVKQAAAPADGTDTVRPPQPEPAVIPGANNDGPPIFTPPAGDDDEPLTVKKWTREDRQIAQGNLEMMLNARSIYLAELGSWISGEPAEKYELTEEQMNRLAQVYTPYMKKLDGKIPDWVWLLLAEGLITGKFVKQVLADRKENKKVAALASSGATQKMAQAANAAQEGARQNFTLFSDGLYLMDAVTNRRLRKELREAQAPPSIDDLPKILEDNQEEVVRALYPQWFGTE